MSLKESKRYVIWNNKGGVGKTTLCFVMATEYAKENPDKLVVVADMCPQANVSEMLLGGNSKGGDNVDKFHNDEQTIASYIEKRSSSLNSKTGTELAFFHKVNTHNKSMPDNIYLVAGDIDLDIYGRVVEFMSNAPNIQGAWKKTHCLLKDLLDSFEGGNKEKEIVSFIDCNPSFASYTELALIASDMLIIPCTADTSSIRGLRNILHLLYKLTLKDFPSSLPTLSDRCHENGLVLPRIKSVILNKTRTRRMEGEREGEREGEPIWASKIFGLILKDLEKTVKAYYKMEKGKSAFVDQKEAEVFNLKDGNTISAVMAHTGKAFSNLTKTEYEIKGAKVQISQDQREMFEECLQDILKSL